MNKGISIYPGLDNTLEENINLVESAAKSGIKRIFTSFNIPETDKNAFKNEIETIFKAAKKLGMEIISDVSPKTREVLDIDISNLKSLRDLGIGTLRLDDGFTPKETARLSRNGEGICLQLNASTICEDFLDELEEHNADFRRIDALHNFYPRKNTGISEDFFVKKNKMLRERGIKVGAFISSEGRKRGPIHE